MSGIAMAAAHRIAIAAESLSASLTYKSAGQRQADDVGSVVQQYDQRQSASRNASPVTVIRSGRPRGRPR